MVYIGIDLGGTNIAVGIVDENGQILCKGSTPTLLPRPYGPIIADIAKCSLETLERSGHTLDDVAAIGAGVGTGVGVAGVGDAVAQAGGCSSSPGVGAGPGVGEGVGVGVGSGTTYGLGASPGCRPSTE